MVEGGRQKRHRVVTVRAVRRRERRSRRRVDRVVCPLPASPVVGIQMALRVSAIGRLDLQIVVIVDVAVGASGHLARRRQLVRIGQRETCAGVIKIRGLQGNRVVASRARRNGKHRRRGGMLWIRRLLPGGEMATCIATIGGRNLQVVVAADVTARAGDIRVSVGQRKIDGRRSVIDGRAEPTVECMAGIACQWKLRGDVVWHAAAHRLRLLQILLVT